MTACPVCSRPMSRTRPNGRRRIYCSHACAVAGARNLGARVDPAAVWRLAHGDPVASTKAERVEATRLLTGRGRTAAQIAALLRVAARSVQRYRSELANRKKAA